MADGKAVPLKVGAFSVGDKVTVSGKAGSAFLLGREVGARKDEESFPATIVGFAGTDRVIVEEDGGLRYSVTAEQLRN